MKRLERNPEWLILGVGALAAVAQALLTDNRDLLVIIVVISLLLAGTTAGIRAEVRQMLRDDVGRVLELIENPQWHDDGRREVNQLRARLREWAEGRRTWTGDAGLAYQVALVNRTKGSLDAIHLAFTRRALERWDEDTAEFSALVDAHTRLSRGVTKRRIIVFDDENEELVSLADGHRRLVDALVVRVCERQIRAPRRKGLGFDLRVLWKTELENTREEFPPDLLISDGKEAVVVKAVAHGGSEFWATEAYTGDVRVADYASLFNAYWRLAAPVRPFLPNGPTERRLRQPNTWFARKPKDGESGVTTA